MVYRLIYRSDAICTPMEDGNILEQSITRNKMRGVTGILIRHSNEYIQVLEGEGQTITDLFHRIHDDKRHANVQILKAGAVDERHFANWYMASVGLDEDAWDTVVELLNRPEQAEVDKILLGFLTR